MFDHIKGKNRTCIDKNKQELSKIVSRQKDWKSKESFPNTNENRKRPPSPNRPNSNNKRYDTNDSHNCTNRNKFRIIFLDIWCSCYSGHDKSGKEHDGDNDSIPCHANLKEELVNIRVSEQVVEKVAVVYDYCGHSHPETISNVH